MIKCKGKLEVLRRLNEMDISLIEEAIVTHLNSLMPEDRENYEISYALILKKLNNLDIIKGNRGG